MQNNIRTHKSRSGEVPRGFATALGTAVIVVGIAVVVVMQYRWNQAVLFDPPRLAQLSYRGEGGEEIAPRYTQADVEAFARLLRSAVKQSYKEKKPAEAGYSLIGPKPSQMRMGIEFRELQDGSFVVEVVAYKMVGKEAQRENAWVQKFPSAELYQARVKTYASQIVNDLWPATTAAPRGI